MFSCFFFFKQKTAYEMRISDWSSDVCSSDLIVRKARARRIDQSELLCLASLPPMFVAVKTAGDEFEIADAGKKLHFLRELVRIDEITRPHDFEPRLIIVLLVVSRRVAIDRKSTGLNSSY